MKSPQLLFLLCSSILFAQRYHVGGAMLTLLSGPPAAMTTHVPPTTAVGPSIQAEPDPATVTTQPDPALHSQVGPTTAGRIHCVTDYWFMITCVLNITDKQVGHATKTNYWLKFNWIQSLRSLRSGKWNKFICSLVKLEYSYNCTVAANLAAQSQESFTNLHRLAIQLCDDADCHDVTNSFDPSQNIEPTPPVNVVVHATPEVYNITWKNGYENHRYLNNELKYQLWIQTFPNPVIDVNKQFYSIATSQFALDTEYCIKVKSHPVGAGHWSKWSPLKCWKTEASEEGRLKLCSIYHHQPLSSNIYFRNIRRIHRNGFHHQAALCHHLRQKSLRRLIFCLLCQHP